MQAVDREECKSQVVCAEDSSFEGGHLGALILLCVAVAATPLLTRRLGFAGFAGGYVVATCAWLVARRCQLSLKATLLLAVVLRLLFLGASPQLSGDVYRYLWDGRVLASGQNPYRYAPDDPRLASLRQPWHGRINHPEIRTIYPPHAELLFALFPTLMVWRLLLLGCEILIILRMPRRSALAYALFPPVIFEGVWNGHIEIVTSTLLLLATAWSLAAAAGLKIIPLVASPAMLRRTWKEIGVFLFVLLVPAVPFLMSGPFMPGFHDYATRWVFNSPLYSILFPMMERLAPHVTEAWTAMKDPLHLEALSDLVYRHIYADFLVRGLMAALAVTGLVTRLTVNERQRDREGAAADCIGILLICSPAIHPWYWIVLVPLVLARVGGGTAGSVPVRGTLWLALTVCAPLSYLLYVKVSALTVFIFCYGVPLSFALVAGLAARKVRAEAVTH